MPARIITQAAAPPARPRRRERETAAAAHERVRRDLDAVREAERRRRTDEAAMLDKLQVRVRPGACVSQWVGGWVCVRARVRARLRACFVCALLRWRFCVLPCARARSVDLHPRASAFACVRARARAPACVRAYAAAQSAISGCGCAVRGHRVSLSDSRV